MKRLSIRLSIVGVLIAGGILAIFQAQRSRNGETHAGADDKEVKQLAGQEKSSLLGANDDPVAPIVEPGSFPSDPHRTHDVVPPVAPDPGRNRQDGPDRTDEAAHDHRLRQRTRFRTGKRAAYLPGYAGRDLRLAHHGGGARWRR